MYIAILCLYKLYCIQMKQENHKTIGTLFHISCKLSTNLRNGDVLFLYKEATCFQNHVFFIGYDTKLLKLNWNVSSFLLVSYITNLLTFWWIVPTQVQFAHNIKDPANILRRSRCHLWQPSMTALTAVLKGSRSPDKQSVFAYTIWVQLIACSFERFQETVTLEKALNE